MTKQELKELIRLAYITGINDTENECEQCCLQGSSERADDLLEEFEESGDLTEVFCND